MHKRYSQLSFVIGLFFCLVALVLLGGYFSSERMNVKLNLYSGVAFFAFGIFMLLTRETEKADE